jgi:hypothetical protein
MKLVNSSAPLVPCAAPLQAEKWEMMLPALALEYISGHTAEFVLSKERYYRSRNAVTGRCMPATRRILQFA